MTRLLHDSSSRCIHHHIRTQCALESASAGKRSTQGIAAAAARSFTAQSSLIQHHQQKQQHASTVVKSSLYNVASTASSSTLLLPLRLPLSLLKTSTTATSSHRYYSSTDHQSTDENNDRDKVYAQLMDSNSNKTLLLSDPILCSMVYDSIRSYAQHHHQQSDEKNMRRATEMLQCVLADKIKNRNVKGDEEEEELMDVIEMVISGWRNTNDTKSIQYISNMLKQLEEYDTVLEESSTSSSIDYVIPYASILGALTKIGGDKKIKTEAALFAERIIDSIEKRQHQQLLRTEMYNAAITCWVHCCNDKFNSSNDDDDSGFRGKDIKPAWRADAILQRMLSPNCEIYKANGRTHFKEEDDDQYYSDHDDTIVKPNKISYNMVLTALANESSGSSNHYAAARRCDEIFRRMVSQYVSDGYNGGVGENDSSMMMKESANNRIIRHAKPDVVTLGTVLSALTQHINDDDDDLQLPNKVGSSSGSDFNRSNDADGLVSEDDTAVNAIEVYLDNLRRAEGLLERMQSLHAETGDIDLAPNTMNFNVVVGALTSLAGSVRKRNSVRRRGGGSGDDHYNYDQQNKHQNDALERAEQLVKHMHQLYDSGANRRCKPDTVTYNSIITAYSKRSGTVRGSAEKAESILKIMMEAGKKKGNGQTLNTPVPDSWTFNSVLSAWARSGAPYGADRASSVLTWMQDYYDAGHSNARPDVVSVSIVVTALASSASRGDKNAALQAETIIDRMQRIYDAGQNEAMKPDALSYTALMRCWANTGEKGAASKTQSILRRMHRMYENGNNDVKPDTVMYNVVLSALDKGRERGSARRAEALLKEMEELYESTGDDDVRPTTVSYSTVMSAWSRSGEKGAAEKAESILRRMQDQWDTGNQYARPNTVAYASVINAWAKSGETGAARRAERLLQRMQDSYDAGNPDVKPNCISCTSVIEAWANSGEEGALSSAETILQRMVDLSKAGDRDVRPNAVTFNTVIKAVVRCRGLGWDRANKAREMLKRMEDAHIRPTVISYNSVLSACAATFPPNDENSGGDFEKKKSDVYQSASNTLNELRSDSRIKPDAYTYPAMFKTCSNTLNVEKDWSKVSDVIDACCDDGLFDERVFNFLKNFAPEKELKEKLGIKGNQKITDVRPEQLPSAWSRNVRQRNNGKRRGDAKRQENRQRRPQGKKAHNNTIT